MDMKKQMKQFLAVALGLVSSLGLAVVASAEDATMTTVTTALSTGFTDIATQALNVIAIIVPIALGIVAAIFVIKKGLGWFKSLARG
jgi:ActR/RegA family two-component response regulator